MQKRRFLGVLFLSGGFFLGGVAKAATLFDPMIGIRVGQVIANKILASPPIPSVAGSRGQGLVHVSPLASYLSVTAESSQESSQEVYSGSLSGYTGGLGFTYDSKTKMSFYGFATFSETNGQITSPTGTQLNDMKNSGLNISSGASYRLWSGINVPVSVGVLGGPFFSNHSSKLMARARNPGDNSENFYDHEYTSQSSLFGVMAGMQLQWKISQFVINPYFLYYKDVSNPCRRFETTAPQEGRDWSASAKSCNAQNQEVYIDGTFYAYGLIVGYRNLSLGVYSEAEQDPDLSSITAQSYTLSYTFDF